MKKLTFLTVVGTVLIWALFFGCALFEPPEAAKNETAKTGVSTDLERKEELALKHLIIPNVSEETLASYVMDFLDADADTGSARNALPSSRVAITKTTKITHPVETGFAEKPADQRSAGSTVGPGELPFYAFTLEDQDTGETGFALTCGDNRIGNVLAVVEQGNYDDDNPGLAVFYSHLNAYIEETIKIYNELTQEDINNALNEKNRSTGSSAPYVPVTDVGRLRNFSLVGSVNDGIYNMTQYILETEWHQGPPYSDLVSSLHGAFPGYYYPAGCGPVAIAQVMAFHGKKRHDKGKPYFQGYDWPSMIDGKNNGLIAILMHEIGRNAGSLYLKMGTSDSKGKTKGGATATTRNGVINAFKAMGYADPGKFKNYNFTDLISAINKGCPVLADGSDAGYIKDGISVAYASGGHYWVIDGYRAMAVEVNDKNKPMYLYITDYVHCNMGWGGNCDGWYFEGVFNTNKIPLDDDNDTLPRKATEDSFFQYGLGMLTGIKTP